tara:strand:+ start:455 stop:667 length:213 start_codon:yes stop_codon:yes gene_type:complete
MEEIFNITKAKYYNNLLGNRDHVIATIEDLDEEGKTIDVEIHVPIDENNRHYKEILRQVDAGTLTIEEAD